MIEHRVLKKVKANEKNFFPNWGAAAPFVGIIFGAFCGGGIGIYFDIALNMLPTITTKLYTENDLMHLYAGLSLQQAHSAKLKSVNQVLWETDNYILNKEIDSLYHRSIEFSYEIDSNFIFQYDTELVYENIILLRIENYIMIGDLGKAVNNYINYGFECNGEMVNEGSIIYCLCLVLNNGICPFD